MFIPLVLKREVTSNAINAEYFRKKLLKPRNMLHLHRATCFDFIVVSNISAGPSGRAF
jgi:hypothetical protein